MQQGNRTSDAYYGILPRNLSNIYSFNPTREADPFLLPPPAPPSYGYGGLFSRLPFGYEDGLSPDHRLRLISESLGQAVHGGAASFELQKMTAQEIMDAKALAASKSHSEAERRRRERINNHLAKLRTLLPNTTKTDKASLLAEVIQHVKELKRQTSVIAEADAVPTETDEITVDDAPSDEDGKWVLRASICCEDRSDLMVDLIKTLKAMRLRILRAEITTLGGRVKNVLFIAGDDDDDDDREQVHREHCVSSVREALRAVVEKSSINGDREFGSVKRQRTNNITNVLEYRSF